ERILATDIKAIQSDSNLKLSTALELGYWGLTINIANDKNKGALSQSEKVRQALELSIDREAINQVVFNGEFVPGNQWINPQNFYYQQAFPIPKRDLAKAKALFDLKIRVTEFATSLKQAEDGDFQLYLIGWSGRSDPDGNSFSFQTCK